MACDLPKRPASGTRAWCSSFPVPVGNWRLTSSHFPTVGPVCSAAARRFTSRTCAGCDGGRGRSAAAHGIQAHHYGHPEPAVGRRGDGTVPVLRSGELQLRLHYAIAGHPVQAGQRGALDAHAGIPPGTRLCRTPTLMRDPSSTAEPASHPESMTRPWAGAQLASKRFRSARRRTCQLLPSCAGAGGAGGGPPGPACWCPGSTRWDFELSWSATMIAARTARPVAMRNDRR